MATATRRTQPTFLLPADPPTRGEERAKRSYRERIRDWNMQVVGEMNAFPYSVYLYYVVKIFVYLWLFQERLMDKGLPWHSEQNVKRFLIYNILGDVLGTNATNGPLGFRVKFFFITWYNMLTPGSITCPLLPGVPAKRHWLQVVGYVAYVASMVSALRAERVGVEQVAPIVGILAVLTPFDFVTFQASRGEHYGYMLFCCLFPWEQTLVAMRLIQSALWFYAGTAKMGPWMKYVNAFMMPNSKFLPLLALLGVPISSLLYKDLPRDVNPSKLLGALAHLAVAGECSLGPLCLLLPAVGVPIATLFHVYILSMTPFASVMEWNIFCLLIVRALFAADGSTSAGAAGGFGGYGLRELVGAVSELHPALRAFLGLVLVIVPIYGQLCPKRVPFLTAYRPYAGNWRFTWHIVDNKHRDKLRKLKSLEGVFVSENALMLWGAMPHFCEQLDDYLTGNMVFFPHFRPLVPMVEKLQQLKGWGADDFTTLFNETFLNAIMGWTLGTGWYVRGRYFDAVASTCGFGPGECYVAVFEPHSLLDHTSEWHLVDITNPDVKIMHGKMPYAELEQLQPTGLSLEAFEQHSVLKGGKAE